MRPIPRMEIDVDRQPLAGSQNFQRGWATLGADGQGEG